MKKRIHGLEMELLAMVSDNNELYPNRTTINKFLRHLKEKYGNSMETSIGYVDDAVMRSVLPNQGQAYIDLSDYLEICTPECTSILDLVRHERISKDIVRRQLKEFNEELRNFPSENKRLHLFSSASDAHRKFTNGCHENYFCYGVGITSKIAEIIATFLIARTILEGTGLFYIKNPSDPLPADKRISFCLSQRIEFIERVFDYSTTFRRPLISNKTETLAGENTFSCARLHVIKGEHNQTPFGNFIKMGTVSLLIDMVEAGYFRDKTIPSFELIKNNAICCHLTELIDRDLDCQRAYDFDNLRQRMRLCDILDIYAEWMLDFLQTGDCRSDSSCCDRLLYLEKLEVAKQLKRTADCFARQDIFSLVGDVEWITKIWWFRDWLETEYGIRIDEDDLSVWTHLETFLPLAIRDRGEREKIINKILWKDLFWHSLDSSESDYAILEESGLINPLVIDGQEVDLSTEGRLNKAPQNPPNRSAARKKLWDFMHKLGLKDYLSTDWLKCRIKKRAEVNVEFFHRSLQCRPRGNIQNIIENFPWGKVFYFNNPLEERNSEVDSFIEQMRLLFEIE
jgi:hypothetical protein